MKYLTLISIFFLFLLQTSSCSYKPDNFVENFSDDGKVIIAGKVLNINKHPELKKFNIYYHNIFELQKIETVMLNDDGSFKTRIPCHYNMDFFIGIQRVSSYLICSPNDSLFITIDADVLNNPKDKYPHGEYFLKVIGGTRVTDNQHVNEFLIGVAKNNASRNEYYKRIKSSTPFEYYNYQHKRYEMEMKISDSLSKNTSARLFKKWSEDFSKYNKIDKLLKYPKRYAKENKMDFDSINIPSKYYDKVFEWTQEDIQIISFYHNAFFNSYYSYLYKQAKKENIDLLQYISLNAKGFNKEIAVSKYLFSLNKDQDTLVDTNFNLVSNNDLRELLKQAIIEVNKKKEELLNHKNKYPVIDTLLAKYKDKVVYIDFWATWCGPCLDEMPYSKKLYEKLKGKPVVFLSLCVQSKYDTWKNAILQKKIPGENYYVTNNQFDELKKIFNISGIPHYLLIDKNGAIYNNAPRPSDKKLIEKISKLLNE